MAKTYRVNHLRFYSKGVLYQEGDLITVDDNVPKSRAWDPIDKPAEAPKQDTKPSPSASRRGGRAADSEPAA